MTALVDTCGWIEWLTDGVLADRYQPYLANPAAVVVPTVVQHELYKWAKRERGEAVALEAVAVTEQGQVQALGTAVALHAADLAPAHRLSFADSLIYGTARHLAVTLVTSDSHFEGLPQVEYLAKAAR